MTLLFSLGDKNQAAVQHVGRGGGDAKPGWETERGS